MIDQIWTISQGGSQKTFDSLGIEDASLVFRSQAPDMLSFTVLTDYDSDALWAYLDDVTVQRDGSTWFVGKAMEPRRVGTSGRESITYTIVGPWFQLERITYQQTHARLYSASLTTRTNSRVILGTDTDGDRLNSQEVITEVVDYALSVVSGFLQLDNDSRAVEFPYEEMSSLSCAEAIKRALRWSPDVVTWFDYTTTPPTLHLDERGDLASADLVIADVVISQNEIRPRPDLVRDRVEVKFEYVNSFDGDQYTTIVEQVAGTDSTGLKTLVLDYQLQGNTFVVQEQAVRAETIQKDSAAWWKKRHSKLVNATVSTIANDSQTAVDDGEANDGTSYSRQLITGSIADWMSQGTCKQEIVADVTYTPAGGVQTTEKLSLTITGTNATTKTYRKVNLTQEAEPEPTGLAQAILDSIETLHYEGSVDLAEDEAGATRYLGNVLNISGGRTAWETMDAMIVEESLSLGGGRTRLTFGPPRYLAPDQLFALSRQTRERRAGDATARSSAVIGAKTEASIRYPETDSIGGGAGELSGFVFQFAAASELTLTWATVLASYDPATDTDWSIEFAVSSNQMTGSVSYVTDTARVDATGSSQTKYRLPVIRDSKRVTVGGLWVEKLDIQSANVIGVMRKEA